jgi:putative 4-mercaptohistidine N1-methyltranferase
MTPTSYESDRLLAEYLLFHYGSAEEVLPYPFGPKEALHYPVRCVTECVARESGGRALDLGCAVGRATFELARRCDTVLGIDLSRRFIAAAQTLQRHGAIAYERADEGELRTPLSACVPAGIDRARVSFETGDATALRDDLGAFDVVLMANLIDRLREPAKCLARLAALVNPGGELVITSPYTWLEDFTPRENWLGGRTQPQGDLTTLEGLRSALSPAFDLIGTNDLPFLIREHARKFQWSVAQASLWRRKT